MRKSLMIIVATLIGMAGAAPAGAELFSATGKVIAILAGDLFVGEAIGHLTGAGTLVLRSRLDPELTCLGNFTSSAALGGSGQMQCSDGATARFQFQRLSIFTGHGEGNLSRGPMSFVYGLTAEEAAPYLKLPAGKRLAHDGAELALVSQ